MIIAGGSKDLFHNNSMFTVTLLQDCETDLTQKSDSESVRSGLLCITSSVQDTVETG